MATDQRMALACSAVSKPPHVRIGSQTSGKRENKAKRNTDEIKRKNKMGEGGLAGVDTDESRDALMLL